MRVDFVIAGNDTSETIYLTDIKKELFWGGSKTTMLDVFDYGEYKFEILDKSTQDLIYSHSFCTFFEEWQTTAEAKHVQKSFYEVITFPYPKNEIILKIYSRSWDGDFNLMFQNTINPNSYLISQGSNVNYKTSKFIDNGLAENHVDVVFLAEGYTKSEMPKFEADAHKMADYLMNTAPFNNYKENFNFYTINSISLESGTDIQGENIYKNTVLNSSFYTFDIPRYLTTQDYKIVRDIAALVPYDQIYIIVNSEKYGGGGIYNHYNLTTVDHPLSEKVFVHEFGHGFAGLADEYYSSDVAYENYFNISIEPWQPNLTTLINFDHKWKHLMNKNTNIPTKADNTNVNVLGVYEGGGYMTKGMYRPFIDCRMKSNNAKGFCPACQDAIVKMILFYSE